MLIIVQDRRGVMWKGVPQLRRRGRGARALVRGQSEAGLEPQLAKNVPARSGLPAGPPARVVAPCRRQPDEVCRLDLATGTGRGTARPGQAEMGRARFSGRSSVLPAIARQTLAPPEDPAPEVRVGLPSGRWEPLPSVRGGRRKFLPSGRGGWRTPANAGPGRHSHRTGRSVAGRFETPLPRGPHAEHGRPSARPPGVRWQTTNGAPESSPVVAVPAGARHAVPIPALPLGVARPHGRQSKDAAHRTAHELAPGARIGPARRPRPLALASRRGQLRRASARGEIPRDCPTPQPRRVAAGWLIKECPAQTGLLPHRVRRDRVRRLRVRRARASRVHAPGAPVHIQGERPTPARLAPGRRTGHRPLRVPEPMTEAGEATSTGPARENVDRRPPALSSRRGPLIRAGRRGASWCGLPFRRTSTRVTWTRRCGRTCARCPRTRRT